MRSFFLALMALFVAGESFALTRASWDVVPNAGYYKGVMKDQSGKASSFVTTSNWIVFDGEVVKVRAFRPTGRLIKVVEFRVEEVSLSESKNAPQPQVESEPEPEPEPVVEEKPEPDPEPVVKETPKPMVQRAGWTSLVAAVGFGVKKTVTEAGITNLDSNSAVGGNYLGLTRKVPNSGLMSDFSLEIHKLKLEQDIPTGTGEEVEAKEIDLLLGDGYLTVGWDFLGEGEETPTRLGISLGVGYSMFPTLEISDDATGSAELKAMSAVGPYVGIDYNLNPRRTAATGLHVGYWTGKVEENQVASIDARLSWSYAFSKPWMFYSALAHRNESINEAVTCQDGTACEDEVSSISTNKLMMGVGRSF